MGIATPANGYNIAQKLSAQPDQVPFDQAAAAAAQMFPAPNAAAGVAQHQQQ